MCAAAATEGGRQGGLFLNRPPQNLRASMENNLGNCKLPMLGIFRMNVVVVNSPSHEH